MENRSLSLSAGLMVFALMSATALAAGEGAVSDQQADWNRRLDKAAALSAEGKAQQAAAGRVLEEKNAVCQKKFLVNACLKDNEKEYTVAARQAKRLENEGQAIERQVRKEQLNEKDAQHQADAARREAEMPGRAAEAAANRNAAETREAKIRSEKATKAEEGAKRKLAAEEKQRQKEAAHNARVSEKMQKAQQRAAETGAAKD